MVNFVPGLCNFMDGSYIELPPYTICTRTAAVSAGVNESTLCLVEEDIPGASLTNHLSPILSLSYPGGYFVEVLTLLSRGSVEQVDLVVSVVHTETE